MKWMKKVKWYKLTTMALEELHIAMKMGIIRFAP